MVFGLVLACSLPPPPVVNDADDDGFRTDQGDCDDHDDLVNPDAVEVCNRVDDDCDGTIDAGVCVDYSFDDAIPSVLGEGGLGAFMVSGRFDGDDGLDLFTLATIGGSSAVCTVGGRRLSGAWAQPLAEVGNCWITSPVPTLRPVVVSAERYDVGLPASQELVLAGTGTGICAVDPFGSAFTLEEAAFACIAEDALPVEFQSGLQLFAADFQRGTLAGTSGSNLGFVDPVEYLRGTPGTPIVVHFPGNVRTGANAGDLDGDGVTELLAASEARVWILPGDNAFSGPVEVVATGYADGDALVLETGPAGDLDGDGAPEWYTVSGASVQVWSGPELFSRLYTSSGPVRSPGDFNGDGRADLWVHYGASPEVSGLVLFLGSTWPVALESGVDGDLTVWSSATDFGASLAAGGDRIRDGFADTWISEPSRVEGEDVRGMIYLLEGWGIDPL